MLYKLGRSVAKEWMNKRGNYSADLSDYNIGGDSHELNHPFTTPSLLQIAPPLQLPCAAGDQLPSTSPLPPRGPHPRCAALPIDPCSRPTTRACRLPPCDCSRSSQQGRRQLAKQQQIITAGTPSTPKAAADHHSRDAVNSPSSTDHHSIAVEQRNGFIASCVYPPKPKATADRHSSDAAASPNTGDSTLRSWNKGTASSHQKSVRATPKDAITSTSDESSDIATFTQNITTVCKVSCSSDHIIVS